MTLCSPTLPDIAAPPKAELSGQLNLTIAHRDGRSYAKSQFHQGALRVLRPHYLDDSGDVTYTIINPGGAYLGADAYDIDVEVVEGARLVLTTQSATKVYRTPQGPAKQTMTLRLGANSVAEYVPDQLIVYRGGSYRQRSRVVMHPSASLVMAEVITPGWAPDGAVFSYDEIRLRAQIDVASDDGDTRVFAVDQLRVIPDETTSEVGVMEGHTHVGQLLVADARVDDDLVDEVHALVDSHDLRAAVSRIGAPDTTGGALSMEGFALRALGDRTEDLVALQSSVVDLLRARWRQRSPLRLRKY